MLPFIQKKDVIKGSMFQALAEATEIAMEKCIGKHDANHYLQVFYN